MSHLMIRKMIRNILLETRGPLGILPVLKAWVKVAAEHGVERDPGITGPGGRPARAEHACLIVPKAHAPKVFNQLTPDLQEWCLKHWRSEEYFNSMISGVMIGLIREYEKPNYAGMKSGSTMIRGSINDQGQMVGSMGGYLTTRTNSRKTNWREGYPAHRRYVWGSNGELNREHWLWSMMEDLAENDSTLVHEFQHWFQESVYYAQGAIKIPTQRRGKSNELPKAKERLRNIMSLKPIHLHIAQNAFSGVDWNTTMRVRGAIAYKLTDAEAFFNSYLPPNPSKSDYAGDGMMDIALKKIQSKGAMKAFIEELLYDFLKLQKIITPEDIDDIADEAMKGGWNPIKRRTQKIMWDKGHPTNDTIDGEETHSKDQKKWRRGDYNPKRDTPRGSGEKTVQGTNSLLNSIGENFNIWVLRSSDFDKQGELKPGKEPVVPTQARAKKATWVVIGRGTQSLPERWHGTSEWKLREKRGISREQTGYHVEWTDRWVEFDAVASEYTVAVIKRIFEYGDNGRVWYLVRGNDQRFAELVSKDVIRKVRDRGFSHVNLRVNVKHIESMVERITDRLIETIEQNEYEDWLASPQSPKPPWSPTNGRPAPASEFDAWASNENPSRIPYGIHSYFEWIFRKASGEDV